MFKKWSFYSYNYYIFLLKTIIYSCSLSGLFFTSKADAGSPSVQVNQNFNPGIVKQGDISRLTITIFNGTINNLTNAGLNNNLPSGLTVAPNPNISSDCNGNITAISNSSLISLVGGTIPKSQGAIAGRCNISVDVRAIVPQNYVNNIPADALTNNENISNGSASNATLQVDALSPITVSNSLSRGTIYINGTSEYIITLNNPNVGTSLNGINLSRTLPINVNLASNIPTQNTCGGTINTTTNSFSLTGGNLVSATNTTTPGTCRIGFLVTSATTGSYTLSVPANVITSDRGVSNNASGNTTLNVVDLVSKSFNTSTIYPNSTAQLTINLNNPNNTTINNATITDNLPSGMTVANPANIQRTNCGSAIVTAVPGSGSITITNATVPVATTTALGVCTVRVNVAIGNLTNGTVLTNIINANTLTNSNNITNGNNATASITVSDNAFTSGSGKSFSPDTITVGQISTLTINIRNNAAVSATNVTVNDNLPTNVRIVNSGLNTPTIGTECKGTPSLNAPNNGTSINLSNTTIDAGKTCTITVKVTSDISGRYLNRISAFTITSSEGWVNRSNLDANLNVQSDLRVSKSFFPTPVNTNSPSTLTINVTNNGNAPLTGVQVIDNLPSNVTAIDTTTATTTCPGGIITTANSSRRVLLQNATIPANSTCNLTIRVRKSTVGSATNTINAGEVTSSQGISNANPATASINAQSMGVSLTQQFNPISVEGGIPSTLTITLRNTSGFTLNNVGFIDNPVNDLIVAANPEAITTCRNGVINVSPDYKSFSLTGADLNSNESCTVQIKMTGTRADNLVNNLPINTITSLQGATNSQASAATLTIIPGANLQKEFDPPSIQPGQVGKLRITIINTNPNQITGIGFQDIFPSGMTVPVNTNINNQCGGNLNIDRNSNPNVVTLTNGTIPANSSCEILVDIQVVSLGTFTNQIISGNLTGINSGGSSTLNSLYQPTIAKSFDVNPIIPNGISRITITISNTNNEALNGVILTDNLPTGMQVAPNPNPQTTCGGDLVANTGETNFTLSNGILPAQIQANQPGQCTIAVNITSNTPGLVNNVIPANALKTTKGATNLSPATASLKVLNYPQITKNFNPNKIPPFGNSNLTIIITNPNEVELNNINFIDEFPANLQAIDNSLNTTCNQGTISVTNNQVDLTNGQLAANSSCNIIVKVTSSQNNTYTNQIPAGALTSNVGANQSPATATIDVQPLTNQASLILVKRITKINGLTEGKRANNTTFDLNTIIDDSANPHDDSYKWPVNFLKGAIDGGIVKSGDEIEYTIYFSASGKSIKNVNICDVINIKNNFVTNTFGPSQDIALLIGNDDTNIVYLTKENDSDRGQFIINSTPPTTCRKPGNLSQLLTIFDIPKGLVVVDIVQGNTSLPSAIGQPNYGWIKFRTIVD